MSGLRPVDETIDQLLNQVESTKRTEIRTLDQAHNCCCARDIISPLDVPPADNSAMDGYAFRFEDTTEGEWIDISDRIPAGYVGSRLAEGTVARIFTGAPVPEGADTVVMQENTEAEGNRVRILKLPNPGANVRGRGQDIETGSIVMRRGDRLSSEALSLISSVGLASVEVFSPLKIAVLSTGDELIEPGEKAGPGQIYNSNRYVLAGLVRDLGMEVVDLGIIPDTPEETDVALKRAAEEADVILSSGGVSVGEEDHVKDAVERLGRIDIWKLAIKPGKPLAYGEVSGVPFFGLPGNPVSAFVTYFVVAKPFLRAMQGYSNVASQYFDVASAFEFTSGSRREYLRVRIVQDENGDLSLEKFQNQGSGIMTSVVWADALAEVEVDHHIMPGDLVRAYPL
ncbi:MAG: molybdopterin molybdotransferase MoeA [Gammaproteobacteria bacterium]|nr:molybdopterin molybdotransferase MoeA [Gammaproteobacteria bacterium]